MNKNNLYIIGAIAAIAGLFLIYRKRDAIVQSPQIGQIGTAPGPDTTVPELAFKSNIFSTYADVIKGQGLNQSKLELAKLQSGIEGQRINSQFELGKLRETETTKRTDILANSQYALALEQQRTIRNQQASNNAANILKAIGSLFSNVASARQAGQMPGSSGGSSGSSIPSYPVPARNPANRNPSDVFRTPPILPDGRSYNGFPSGYNPNVFFDSSGFTFGDFNFGDPFSNVPYFGDYLPDNSNPYAGSLGGGWFSDFPVLGDNPYPQYGDYGWNFDPETGDYIGG